MIEFLICGIRNNSIVPISIDNNNKLSMTIGMANNKCAGKANLSGLLCGIHKSKITPVRIDNNGKVII